jgi:ABC-type amino acid transport substrate-binding protein
MSSFIAINLLMLKKYINVEKMVVVFILLIVTGCAPTIVNINSVSSNKIAIKKLQSGEADAVVGDYAVMAYEARESAGTMKVTSQQFNIETIGIGVTKDAPELKAVVEDALKKVMDDSTYQKILVTWALAAGKISSPPAVENVPEVANVPELADGELKVGIELSYPPMEFFNEFKQEAGVDPELARAIGKILGVEVVFVDMTFDSLIDAVESKKVDVVISAVTITEERSQRIDFIPYLQMGTGILVNKSNPKGIRRLEDLCGNTVAVQESSSQLSTIEALDCL